MVKHDGRSASLEEFEQTVREIMDIHDSGYDDSFEDSMEYVISDTLSDPSSDELSSGSNSNSSTIKEVLVISPKVTCESKPDVIDCGQLDDSEDFPVGNCDSEASVMASQLNHLSVAEHRDAENLIDTERRKKKIKKRCENLDD